MADISLEQYISNKREAELRKDGYVQYASVTRMCAGTMCPCNGDNITHRAVAKEWRKAPKAPDPKLNKENM